MWGCQYGGIIDVYYGTRVWGSVVLPRAHGDHRMILPSFHHHILNGGIAAVQIEVPAEVAFAVRDNSADKLADQVGAGFRLGQIQNLFQGFLNPAPLGLVEVRFLRILVSFSYSAVSF